ncbi:BRICHOS domain-containing protein 5 isoform X2 [Centrocercus urophasianus]|uniref:BRICHOS domain-containing protein 5 isoform X2 n=1 Tax=Centrocercus urophasianus TaxID=9002 RepID=UPI001C6541BC|nr:BRICHOS domain-containing protein 5 isoform X2 [Centrocercus urophasianus]
MEGGNSPSDAVSAGRRFAARFTNPPRTFWIILSITLLFAAVGISVGGILCFSHSSAQAGPQLSRITLHGEQDVPRNQTATVDVSRSTVTYYITSRSNRSAIVLYDSQHGYVCYRPAEQHACYLRTMDPEDRETAQGDKLLLRNNQTKYYREFLGIVAGKQVDPNGLGEAIQALCEQTSIFWVQRADGKLHLLLQKRKATLVEDLNKSRAVLHKSEWAAKAGTGDLCFKIRPLFSHC